MSRIITLTIKVHIALYGNMIYLGKCAHQGIEIFFDFFLNFLLLFNIFLKTPFDTKYFRVPI